MRFRSRVDGALLVPVGVAVCVAFGALAAAPPAASRLIWIPVAVTVLVAGSVLWVLCTTYYELTRDELVVHCGPFTWRVPFADIRAVRPSRSVLSAPALSLDRLEIEYSRGQKLVISPADKAGFMSALQHRVPGLSAPGEG